MATFDKASLVAAAGIDAWALRDQFTAGDPEEIYAMAKAFNTAAAQQGDAVQLATRGLETAGDGYKVNNATPIDVDAEVAATSRSLGNNGDKLGKIAKLLSETASDLSVRTTTANTGVADLETAVNGVITKWNTFWQGTGHHLPEEDWRPVRDSYVAEAVQKVKDFGAPIKQSIADYETYLQSHLRSMVDLGYIPSDAADEGPGDVNLSAAAAQADAGKVNAALGLPPGKDGILGIQDGSRTVALLNAKVAAGYKLTPAERAYLDAWYNAVGADNLAKIPGYVRKAAPSMVDNRRGPDGLPTRSADDVYRSVVTPIANGIMNLSNPDVGGHTSYKDMPQAVKDVVEGRVGYVDPATGRRVANPNFLFPGDKDFEHWAQNSVNGGVVGLDRFNGFSDLMAASDVNGGTEFTKELAGSAIRAKQDLNAIQAQARWTLDHMYGGADPALLAQLNKMTDESHSVQLLHVVARNHDGSSAVLMDPALRPEVLGMKWEDESGVIDVLQSGTERDPSRGGGHPDQAKAALAVIQEVGGDRDGYLGRMDENMEDTVKNIGLEYIDSFARDPAGNSGYVGNGTDPLGRKLGPSFQLTGSDRDHFLQFISGTGDDDAIDFQAKATAYSQVMLTEAFTSGDPKAVQEALHEAALLDGSITQANFDYTFDTTDAGDKEAAAAARAASMQHLAIKTGISFGTTLIGTGITVATGGAAGPVVGIATAIINGGAALGIVDDPAPGAQLPTTRDQLLHEDHQTYEPRRDYLVLSAAVNAGVVDPATLPPGLTTTDANGNVVLRQPGDLDDTQTKIDLRTSTTQALNTYEAAHRTATNSADIDLGDYDQTRGNVADGTWDHSNPRGSVWTSDPQRGQYGDNEPPPDKFPQWPTDPGKLDNPDYDPADPDR